MLRQCERSYDKEVLGTLTCVNEMLHLFFLDFLLKILALEALWLEKISTWGIITTLTPCFEVAGTRRIRRPLKSVLLHGKWQPCKGN